MKINWGLGIVVAMISFIGFILYYVGLATLDPNYDNELQTTEYYIKEKAVNSDYQKIKNKKDLGDNFSFKEVPTGILISFPKNEKIEGKVFFYRPDNEKRDTYFNISVTNGEMLIPYTAFDKGRWDVRVEWKSGDKEFLHLQKIPIQ